MSRSLQLENRPKTYLKGNRKETFLQNKKGKSVKFVQLSKLLEVVRLEKGIEEKKNSKVIAMAQWEKESFVHSVSIKELSLFI